MQTFALRFNRCFAPILFSLAVAVAPLHAAGTQYLRDGKPDVIALLAPPPLAGSLEQTADLAEVRAVRHACTPDEQAAAYSEKKFDIFNFTPAIGEFFQPGKFPETEEFFHHVQKEAEAVTDNAKDFYKRPRPYAVDPSLANGKMETNFSYPSGHSTESMVLALVLADLFPGQHDAIIAEARTIGWHRVEIARHYPTDIYAGRVLAQAIVREMKKSDAFQKDFAKAQTEIASVQKTGMAGK